MCNICTTPLVVLCSSHVPKIIKLRQGIQMLQAETPVGITLVGPPCIRYDTIRYSVFACAQKLTRWPAWSSARHRNEKIWKKWKQKPSSSEGTVRVIVREGSPGGRSETTGVGFVKQVGFKPGVKERGSYGWAEWWIKRGRSDGWRSRWVGI